MLYTHDGTFQTSYDRRKNRAYSRCLHTLDIVYGFALSNPLTQNLLIQHVGINMNLCLTLLLILVVFVISSKDS